MTTTAAIGRRLTELEAGARRLLPQAAAPFDPVGWLEWLSGGELARLELRIEDQVEAGDPVADIPDDLYRRALGRAVMGIDVRQLDEQERAGQQLLTFANPARPGDRKSVLYISYCRDLVAPDRWHMDAQYQRQHPSLPGELTTAELEQYNPRPWPPRATAGTGQGSSRPRPSS